ncbi:MAG: UDP-3-O-(3-hydroxymyristoyl)glucosamine N-acyltransferase [Bdellovibrionota bacterium]
MKRFPEFFIESSGDLERVIDSVTAPEEGRPGAAVFLGTPKALEAGLASKASVLVVGAKQKATAEARRGDRTILVVKSVEWTMAKILNEYFRKTPYRSSTITTVHPKATVAGDAKLGEGCIVGPGAFIGARVALGKNVYVGANSVIEDGSEIGDDCTIHPLVFIGSETIMGRGCEIHPNTTVAKEGFGYGHDDKGNHTRIPHLGRVVLEDDVHIGGGCSIDRATFGETRIERGAKLDNQIHLAHNCSIGRNSLVTAGFMSAGSTKIGANFMSGGGAVTTGHIEICDNVQIGGFSAVSKSISTPGQYGGNPLQPLQQFLKTKAAMTHLPEMRRQIKLIMKHLGLSDASSESANEN